jgi:hypothetical protein
MTEKTIDNALYDFLIGAISNALPLEFAIRASESLDLEAMMRLKEIDEEIRDCLRSWGARKEEIDADNFIDYAWDLLQIGIPRVRLHGRLMRTDARRILVQCEKEINSKINLKKSDLALPVLRYFRVCDLLKGNNIEELLSAAKGVLSTAREYEKSSDIDLKEFAPLLRVRQPVHLHPDVGIGADYTETKEIRLWLFAKATGDFSELDIERQLSEFLYQLALIREQQAYPREDAISGALFGKFVKKDVAGDLSENKIVRLNGIAAALAGLYCRDLHKRRGFSLDDAKEEAQKLFDYSEDALAKNYKKTNAQIKIYLKKFEKLM